MPAHWEHEDPQMDANERELLATAGTTLKRMVRSNSQTFVEPLSSTPAFPQRPGSYNPVLQPQQDGIEPASPRISAGSRSSCTSSPVRHSPASSVVPNRGVRNQQATRELVASMAGLSSAATQLLMRLPTRPNSVTTSPSLSRRNSDKMHSDSGRDSGHNQADTGTSRHRRNGFDASSIRGLIAAVRNASTGSARSRRNSRSSPGHARVQQSAFSNTSQQAQPSKHGTSTPGSEAPAWPARRKSIGAMAGFLDAQGNVNPVPPSQQPATEEPALAAVQSMPGTGVQALHRKPTPPKDAILVTSSLMQIAGVPGVGGARALARPTSAKVISGGRQITSNNGLPVHQPLDAGMVPCGTYSDNGAQVVSLQRPSSGGLGASAGVQRPSSGGLGASAGVLRPSSGGLGASVGVLRPSSGGLGASAGMLRPSSGESASGSGLHRNSHSSPGAAPALHRPNQSPSQLGNPLISVGSFTQGLVVSRDHSSSGGWPTPPSTRAPSSVQMTVTAPSGLLEQVALGLDSSPSRLPHHPAPDRSRTAPNISRSLLRVGSSSKSFERSPARTMDGRAVDEGVGSLGRTLSRAAQSSQPQITALAHALAARGSGMSRPVTPPPAEADIAFGTMGEVSFGGQAAIAAAREVIAGNNHKSCGSHGSRGSTSSAQAQSSGSVYSIEFEGDGEEGVEDVEWSGVVRGSATAHVPRSSLGKTDTSARSHAQPEIVLYPSTCEANHGLLETVDVCAKTSAADQLARESSAAVDAGISQQQQLVQQDDQAQFTLRPRGRTLSAAGNRHLSPSHSARLFLLPPSPEPHSCPLAGIALQPTPPAHSPTNADLLGSFGRLSSASGCVPSPPPGTVERTSVGSRASRDSRGSVCSTASGISPVQANRRLTLAAGISPRESGVTVRPPSTAGTSPCASSATHLFTQQQQQEQQQQQQQHHMDVSPAGHTHTLKRGLGGLASGSPKPSSLDLTRLPHQQQGAEEQLGVSLLDSGGQLASGVVPGSRLLTSSPGGLSPVLPLPKSGMYIRSVAAAMHARASSPGLDSPHGGDNWGPLRPVVARPLAGSSDGRPVERFLGGSSGHCRLSDRSLAGSNDGRLAERLMVGNSSDGRPTDQSQSESSDSRQAVRLLTIGSNSKSPEWPPQRSSDGRSAGSARLSLGREKLALEPTIQAAQGDRLLVNDTRISLTGEKRISLTGEVTATGKSAVTRLAEAAVAPGKRASTHRVTDGHSAAPTKAGQSVLPAAVDHTAQATRVAHVMQTMQAARAAAPNDPAHQITTAGALRRESEEASPSRAAAGTSSASRSTSTLVPCVTAAKDRSVPQPQSVIQEPHGEPGTVPSPVSGQGQSRSLVPTKKPPTLPQCRVS